jgi:hypothetical protein
MRAITAIAWLTVAPLLFGSDRQTVPSVPVRMVLNYGRPSPLLTPDDLTVALQFDPLPIVSLAPLRGSLELYILVDSCSTCEPGPKLEELSRFIASQPSTTSIGVAYIQDGTLKIAEKPTTDRERAVKALSVPAGTRLSGPYTALADLITNWKTGAPRRVVLMISTGINPNAKDNLQDPTAEAAIAAAQRGQVTVYTVYHPSADYQTADPSRIYSGQVQLAHVGTETGGEGYFLNDGPLASLAPFLSDIGEHLNNQYLLEFLAPDTGRPGSLQSVTLQTKHSDLELMAPYQVWVPGSRK